MTKKLTHTSRRTQAIAPKYSGELAEPITVVLSGDDEADDAAIRKAARIAFDKLPALAEHLGVKLDSIDAIISLMNPVVTALASETVPGFQFRLVKKAGRKKQKDAAYHLGLSAAYEVFVKENVEAVTKAAFSQEFAEHEYRQKHRGRIGANGRAEINRRARQISNDLSAVARPEYRRFTQEILRLSTDGKAPEEILNHLESMNKN